MHLLIRLVICTCVVQRSSCTNFVWNNHFDEMLDFKCHSPNQFISIVVSEHHNDYEDRRFDLSCRDIIPGGGNRGATTCKHSGYVNNFHAESRGRLAYSCPGNGYINGMASVHDNGHEDRRWNFYCCERPDIRRSRCSSTNYTNNFDGWQNYIVPDGSIMIGVYSTYSNYHKDRLFGYRICTFDWLH